MHSSGKYVTGKVGGFECAVCIPETVGHDALRGLFTEITGAGFFTVVEDTKSPTHLSASCYGKSVSLKIESNPEIDNLLVGRALGINPRL